MIEVTSATAFMLYLYMTISCLLILWGTHHFRGRHKKKVSQAHILHLCEYCQFAYLDENPKNVTKCPQCGSFNKNNTYRGK